MSASFVKGTTTSIKHNNRDFKEKDWETKYHSHIERDRESENKYLISTPIREKYDELFGEEVERYNATQKRNDRKIDDYYDKVKNDKTLNTQYEFIVQVGTKDDFDLYSNYKFANEILEEYTESFEDRNPHLKIYNAVIHNDEASPHLHLNVIPVADGYKQGIKKRPAFNKAIENQGFERTGDSRQVFREWRNSELSEIEKLMNKREIKREKVGTNNIQSMPEYKALQKELEGKNKELERKKSEVAALASDKSKKADRSKLGAKYETKTVQVPSGEIIGKGKLSYEFKKKIEKKTGNVIIPKEKLDKFLQDHDDLYNANQQLKRYVETDLPKENKKLIADYNDLHRRFNMNVTDYNELLEENRSLKKENNSLKEKVESLKNEIKNIFQSVKSFFKAHAPNLETAKTLSKGLGQEIARNDSRGEYSRLEEQENKRTRSRGRSR